MTPSQQIILIFLPLPPGYQGCSYCSPWAPERLSALRDIRCKGCGQWHVKRTGITTSRESTSRQREYCCERCKAMPFELWLSDRQKKYYKRKAARQKLFGSGLDTAITLAPVIVEAEYVLVLEDRKHELSIDQMFAIFRR